MHLVQVMQPAAAVRGDSGVRGGDARQHAVRQAHEPAAFPARPQGCRHEIHLMRARATRSVSSFVSQPSTQFDTRHKSVLAFAHVLLLSVGFAIQLETSAGFIRAMQGPGKVKSESITGQDMHLWSKCMHAGSQWGE